MHRAHLVKRGDPSRPRMKNLGRAVEHLCRLSIDCAAHLVPGLIIDGHAVLLAAMLLDFWHNLLFAVTADLPITVLRSYIRALKVHSALTFLLLVRNVGIHIVIVLTCSSHSQPETIPS